MPTIGVTRITVTQAIRAAGSRCGRSSARQMNATCSIAWKTTSTHPGVDRALMLGPRERRIASMGLLGRSAAGRVQ